MEDMNRRDFVIAAVGGLGLLSVDTQPVQRGMHVRHNVYCLNPRCREIRSYATAVTTMQARPSTDPTSWSAQAAIHGTLAPIAGMIVSQCEHGTRFFLSWHRMFLYYFERIVRAASGDPAFGLPYWGYSPTGDRALPLPFRTPANPTNSLYVSNRRVAINAGTPINSSVVDAGVALSQLLFNPFSFTLEGTPHGAVHVAVGGLMGSVPTAGQDPIFWLHHANIDRLWDVWIASGSGRTNPSDAPWLTRSWDFYDETGARVSMTGSQVLDAAQQLRYRYAPDACGQGVARGFDRQALRRLTRLPPDAHTLAFEDSLRRRPPRGEAMISAQTQGPVSLGAAPAVAQLPISPEARRLLATFLKDRAVGSGLVLALEDVRAEGPVDVFYELYVNVPAGAKDTVHTGPYYLGNLDFFGAVEGSIQRQFNMVPVFRRLQALGAWAEDTVRLTFVPRAFVEGEDPAKLLGQRTQGRVGRAVLRIE